MDKSSIVRYLENDSAATVVIDFKTLQRNKKGESYKSMENVMHFDCASNSMKSSHTRVYAGNMLAGTKIADGSLSETFRLVPSGTSLSELYKVVCN